MLLIVTDKMFGAGLNTDTLDANNGLEGTFTVKIGIRAKTTVRGHQGNGIYKYYIYLSQPRPAFGFRIFRTFVKLRLRQRKENPRCPWKAPDTHWKKFSMPRNFATEHLT